MACCQLLFTIFFAFLLNFASGTVSNYLIFVNHQSSMSLLNDEAKWLNERIIYNYEVIKSFAAWLTEEEADYLANTRGVIVMLKNQVVVQLHTIRSPEFLGLNVNFGLWPKTKSARNIIIGLGDNGIWPEAESFNDVGLEPMPSSWKGYCEDEHDFNSSLCNKKLIGARYFTKGIQNFQLGAGVKQLNGNFLSPRDGDGHGTHTASIAAGAAVQNANLFGFANGTARGIATNARIAMYKVLGEYPTPT